MKRMMMMLMLGVVIFGFCFTASDAIAEHGLPEAADWISSAEYQLGTANMFYNNANSAFQAGDMQRAGGMLNMVVYPLGQAVALTVVAKTSNPNSLQRRRISKLEKETQELERNAKVLKIKTELAKKK